jgi:acyl carrier protein
MDLHEELREFVKKTLHDLGVPMPSGGLTPDTSLLRSGLFDSMAVLNLVAWVEAHSGAPLDPIKIDPIKQWDTMADIIRFCGASEPAGTKGAQ